MTIRAENSITLSRVNDGTNGTVIVSVEYKGGDSGTTPPSGTWYSTPPEIQNGTYLWTRTTYSDHNVAYSVAYQGEDAGLEAYIVSFKRYFVLSSTAPELPDPPISPLPSPWQLNEPTYQSGNVTLWYVDVTVYSDETIEYSDIFSSYTYTVASDAKSLVETIDSNYVQWDINRSIFINKQTGEEIDTIKEYLKSYMQFTTTTNDKNPLLLLGDGSGSFITAVSNKGMHFYQDVSVEDVRLDMESSNPSTLAIAYFDNNKMKINRGVIVNNLQTGHFRWEAQQNNNLLFRWIGG